MNSELLAEINKLQLPHHFGAEIDAGWIEELLAEFGKSASDLAYQLADDVRRWQEGSKPSNLVEYVVGAYLELVRVDEFSLSGEQYLGLFDRVQVGDKKNWRGVDWFTAKALLSKARLIGYLQCEERYSASQVVKVLSATERSLRVPFQAVNLVGGCFGASVVPPEKDVIDFTWEIAEKLGNNLFVDASIIESCYIASQKANEYTPTQTLQSDLVALSGEASGSGPSWNYLQMLYWQALILEFYDHPSTRLYEFVPRGESAKHAFKKFEVSTDNPFLNNAKGTAALGAEWALNRGGLDAHALVSVLALLEDHPRSASVETARILRAWIVRTLALEREKRAYLEILDLHEAFERLVNEVCSGGTNTYGVLEQRVVDTLGVLIYSKDSWRSSGLGDHVNATNTSRKKLGDIEFASVEQLQAVAIEAHGGRLTRAYLDSHNLSLERSIGNRLESAWLGLAEAKDWKVQVIFVAHQFSNEEFPVESEMHGVTVKFEYINYYELQKRAFENSKITQREDAFNKWIVSVLNSSNVRQSVRQKAAELLGDAACLKPLMSDDPN